MMYRLEMHSLDTDDDGFYITDYVVINEVQYKDIMEIAMQVVEFYEPAKDIIRCLDCTHYNGGDCEEMPKLVSADDYCSWAERKTE